MLNYKNGKWARQIVDLQHEDGTWGSNFHTLGRSTKENPLTINKDENNQWDLGSKANDSINLPLSDSWRKAEDRKIDCTKRINSLIKKITGSFY